MQLVRMVAYVTKAQRAKVQRLSKEEKKRDPKSTESSIIRRAIDNL